MKRVKLQNNKGFKWYSSENCFVKGYITDTAGKFYDQEQLVDYFKGADSFVDFEERVKYAKGAFTVIFKKDEELFVATDIIRAFPIFYIRIRGEWVISDDPYYLADSGIFKEANHAGTIEFLATGFVTGNETLIEGVRQVQAGEVIRFSSDDLAPKFYFTYRVPHIVDEEYKDLKIAGKEVIEGTFKRFIDSLNGKTAVIPRSGGFDSRLIAVMLRHFNYKKVICFTYGRKTSSELAYSRKVAEILGFKWHYITYDDKLINGFLKDGEFRDYYKFGSNMTSMFYMQEYFAVKYLKDQSLIPKDSVFIPGHSGDFIAGSMLNKHGNLSIQESMNEVVERIYDIKYCLVKPSRKYADQLKERIMKNLQEKFSREADLSYSIHEDWDLKEKFAKFIFNSSSIYTFFDYEFRAPFWDLEIVNFFKYLPLTAKLNKYLYDDILRGDYFKDYDVNFKKELQPRERDIRKLRLKAKIKRHLPESIKVLFINKKEDLFYYEITKILREDLLSKGKKIRIHGNSYNSIIIQWYIEEFTKEYLRN